MPLIYYSPLILQTLVYPYTWVALRFFAHIRIRGLEHVRGMKSGVIFAVNHTSQLDPILIPATLPFLSRLMPMFYVSREKNFYLNAGEKDSIFVKIFYGGNFFKLWGAYPATVGTGDYEIALRNHIRILNNKRSVCIFPEGKRTRNGFLGEGKPGAAYLLWKTGSPVIPVAIHGNYKLSFYDFISRKAAITVSYGKPILPADVYTTAIKEGRAPTLEELKDATSLIMSRIQELLKT